MPTVAGLFHKFYKQPKMRLTRAKFVQKICVLHVLAMYMKIGVIIMIIIVKGVGKLGKNLEI